MKRRDLIKAIKDRAKAASLAVSLEEGAKHTKVIVGERRATIPRHTEVNHLTAGAILKQLFQDG